MNILVMVAKSASIVMCCAVFAAFAYLQSMGLRENPPVGLLWGIIVEIKEVLLVPGLLPLAILVIWILKTQSSRYFLQGLLIVLCLLAFHYVLVAAAVHSDTAYVWAQIGELALCGFALYQLLKPQSVIATLT